MRVKRDMIDSYSKHKARGLLDRARCGGFSMIRRNFMLLSVYAGAICVSAQVQGQQGRLVVLDANKMGGISRHAG